MAACYPLSVIDNHGFVSQVSSRVQYPEDYKDLSYEDLKDFKQTRYGNI